MLGAWICQMAPTSKVQEVGSLLVWEYTWIGFVTLCGWKSKSCKTLFLLMTLCCRMLSFSHNKLTSLFVTDGESQKYHGKLSMANRTAWNSTIGKNSYDHYYQHCIYWEEGVWGLKTHKNDWSSHEVPKTVHSVNYIMTDACTILWLLTATLLSEIWDSSDHQPPPELWQIQPWFYEHFSADVKCEQTHSK